MCLVTYFAHFVYTFGNDTEVQNTTTTRTGEQSLENAFLAVVPCKPGYSYINGGCVKDYR